jgi:site-specific DNA recombinase
MRDQSYTRLLVYTRCSDAEQDTYDAQLAACREHASRLGGTIIRTESDRGISGLDPKRPGYQRVLAAARAREIDGVVVWKLDRRGRDAVEGIRAAQELDSLGVKVHSCTQNLDDPFIRDLLFLLGRRESEQTAERVRMKMRADAAEGKWGGKAPLGYRINPDTRHLEPDASAPVVARIFELFASGQHTLRSVRDEARKLGLLTSRANIAVILKSPAYVGDVTWGRVHHGKTTGKRPAAPDSWVVARNAHPALVDRDTFAKV